MLGYKVTGPNGINNKNISRDVMDMASRLIKKYDAFQDNPWPIIFKELDKCCPGSKFILTLRPTEKWIERQVGHFGEDKTPMREWIYGAGCPKGNEGAYVLRYERHNKEVLDYFQNRDNDLLTLRITEGEVWEKFCPFLHKEIPNASFPAANKAVNRNRARTGLDNMLVRMNNRLKRIFR